MRKKIVLPLVLTILFIQLACTIGWGLDFSDGETVEEQAENAQLIQMLTKGSEVSVTPAPPVAAEPEPLNQPAAPVASESESVTAGVTEYSATSTNFNCICQDNGNVTTEFKFVGDQLELDGQLYDKTGNNTYKRSWMGYYILVSGEGDQKTETKVDEEKSVVIMLTDTGYVLEHYSGDSGSACCYYTFTKIK